jgi:hypothetical protein
MAPAEKAARICKLREAKHVNDIKIASAEGKHWPSLLQVAWGNKKKKNARFITTTHSNQG